MLSENLKLDRCLKKIITPPQYKIFNKFLCNEIGWNLGVIGKLKQVNYGDERFNLTIQTSNLSAEKVCNL